MGEADKYGIASLPGATLSSYTPSARERLRYGLMDYYGGQTRDPEERLKAMGMADFAMKVIGLTPAEIPLIAYDMGASAASGDYGRAALGIASLAPVSRIAPKSVTREAMAGFPSIFGRINPAVKSVAQVGDEIYAKYPILREIGQKEDKIPLPDFYYPRSLAEHREKKRAQKIGNILEHMENVTSPVDLFARTVAGRNLTDTERAIANGYLAGFGAFASDQFQYPKEGN